jgi:hypothetical protein
MNVLADPHQATVSEIVLFEYLQVPVSHEVTLVLPESKGGSLSNEHAGIREIWIRVHHYLGVPFGVDGIQVTLVPPLEVPSRKLRRVSRDAQRRSVRLSANQHFEARPTASDGIM